MMNWKNPIMKNTVVNPERLIEIRDRANKEINRNINMSILTNPNVKQKITN